MTTDKEINAAMLRCLASYGKHIAKSVGGEVIERDAFVLCNGSYVSGPKNMVVPSRSLTLDEAQELASLISDFYSGSDRWLLWTLSDQPALETAGLRQSQYINPTMTLGTDAIGEFPAVQGLTINEVTTEAQVQLFEKSREEWRGGQFAKNPNRGDYLDERVLAPFHRLWIGYINEEPVVTGAIFESDSVSMVKNIAVDPQYRRQGIGASMSAHVINQANATPVLDADGDAPKLYERLGFRQMGQLRFWLSA